MAKMFSCAECSAKVRDERRAEHIYEQHLREQLFICPGCDYFSTHDEHDVEQHIARQHAVLKVVGVISHIHIYADEIRDWNNRCWPNNAYTSTGENEDCQKDYSSEDEDADVSKIDTAESNDCDIAVASSVGKVPLVHFCESDEAMGIYCHVCEVFINGLADEHVYRAHLNETMYQCPLCDFSSKHSKQGVLDHIDQSHGDMRPLPPLISLEEKFRYEFANWNLLCWEKQERSEMESPPSKYFDDEDKKNCRSIDQILNMLDRSGDSVEHESIVETQKVVETTSCYCAECSTTFGESKSMHIYRVHLKQQLFLCPKCPYSSMYDKQHIATHLNEVHGIAEEWQVISRVELLRDKIVQWESRCFTRRKVCWNRTTPNPLRRTAKRTLKPMRAKAKGRSQSTFFDCHLCNVAVKNFAMRAHVFKEHLNIDDLFQCGHCDFRSNCDKRLVERHVEKEHADVENRIVISRLHEFKNELTDYERQCWPRGDRGRQNEHEWLTCGMCEQVVKSLDRRRHVLREHVAVADMYSCRHCTFANEYLRESVTRHSTSLHGDPKINDRVEELKEQVNDVMLRCFPLRNKPVTSGRMFQTAGVYIKPAQSPRDPNCSYCLVCAKSFGESAANHVRRYHMPMMYQSAVCGYSAMDTRSVDSHIRAHHSQALYSADCVINKSALYADEMIKAYKNCFQRLPTVSAANQLTKQSDGAASRCRLCALPVATDDRKKHIFEHHLAVNDLFKCSACGFDSAFDEQLIVQHAVEVHGDGRLVVSKVFESAERVTSFETACFNADAESVAKQCSTAFDVKRYCSKKETVCAMCDNALPVARHRMKEHVWKLHMPTLPFKCPFCEEHRMRPCDIKTHVHRYHRKEKRVDMINKTHVLKEHFIEQFKLCFN